MLDREPDPPPPSGPELAERYAAATYRKPDGSQLPRMLELRDREHLCGTCYHAGICKHAPDPQADELLVVISRCLAYEPTST